jgi:hypothetical protein
MLSHANIPITPFQLTAITALSPFAAEFVSPVLAPFNILLRDCWPRSLNSLHKIL